MNETNDRGLLLPHVTCQKQRINLRLGYPKTCQQCGLFGTCAVYPPETIPSNSSGGVLEVSGLYFDQAELDCKNGNC